MKRYFFRMTVCTLMAYTAFMLPSCDTKDDELWERVDELFERVEKLENACTQMNTDIRSIQSVLSAIQNNYSITSVTPLENEKGYTITFSNGQKITINHGKDGENGADGKDGKTPTISIKDMGNGQYAWLLNGELLCDAQGNPIPVNGQDGEDGEDGEDGYNGTSAPTPIVKTGSELISSGINGSWDREAVYISVNNGYSWTKISTGNGGSIFSSVDISNVGYITFTLANGIKFSVPRTDDLASLIIGKWNYIRGAEFSKIYQFNKDRTYIETDQHGNDVESGTYEVLNERNSIFFQGNKKEYYSEMLVDFIIVNEYLLKWCWGGSEVYYLYRHDAFIFDKTEINAPQEGGTFTIQVDAQFPLKVSDDKSNYIDNSNTNNIYASTNSTLKFTPSVVENSIIVDIEPNMGNLNLKAEFYIEDLYGNRITTITINQEKNTETTSGEVYLSEYGKTILLETISSSYSSSYKTACSQLQYLSWAYATGKDAEFKPRLSSDNPGLINTWEYVYSAINAINKILYQAEQEFSNGPLKAPLETLRALLYYNLAVCWGNINYVTEESINDISAIRQLTTVQLFEQLIPQLDNAVDVLEERRIPDLYNGIEDYIYLSKDNARIILAKIYMYLEKYEEAEPLLQTMKKSTFYDKYSYIFMIDSYDYLYSYMTDIVLGLAECKLNSDSPSDADIYINEAIKDGLHIENTDRKLMMQEIYTEFHKNTLYGGYMDYFAFLKRNGLAKETIGITEDYQLLFPIPQSEINLNPNMKQNPGY